MSSNNRAKREERAMRQYEQSQAQTAPDEIEYVAASRKKIETLNFSQEQHRTALIHDNMVIAIGSAGTGKTFLSAAVAADLYLQNHFKYIVMTRPAVEVGETLGFLPGEIDEKYAPYLAPFKKALISRLGSTKYTCDLKKKLLPMPLNYMRGETFDDTIMLLDEAQNVTVEQMKMFLTRVGQNCKVFISGDIYQSDLDKKTESGLAWLVKQLKARHKPYEIIEYKRSDCVRSDFCKDMLEIIENEV